MSAKNSAIKLVAGNSNPALAREIAKWLGLELTKASVLELDDGVFFPDPPRTWAFICSVNCSTNNAPSDLMWSVVVRFNQVGTIGYYCDQHGDTTSGMRGSITVIDRVFVDGFDMGSPPS